MQFAELLRENCPNILFLRRAVSKWRISKLQKRIMARKDILFVEQHPESKSQIVEQYKNKWPKYYSIINDRIYTILGKAKAYSERKDIDAVITDILFCRFAYGFLPEEYISFKLENKTPEERKQFVADMERIRYDCQMSDMADSAVYKDKMKTYAFFQKYYARDAISIEKEQDFKFFERFVIEHPIFVAKAVYESCGRSISLENIKDYKTPRELFQKLISAGKHILEERIEQGDVLSNLNESSVNTIRCMTFNTRHGIKIPYTFIKVGRAGSFVDNGGAGGILAAIDPETGKIITNGFDEYGKEFIRHPDSGMEFKGYQLPAWDELMSMCREMSIKTPTVRYIGWDLAYTPDGWVLVEGNNCGQMIGPQITLQSGIKAVIKELMADMDLMVK